MDSASIAKSAKDVADTAASNLRSGIQEAKQTIDKGADRSSSKAEDTRAGSKPVIEQMRDQAQSFAEGVTVTGRQFRDAASRASDSLTSFTKDNPLKAILIAAVSGAVLLTLFKAITRSRRH